MSFFLEESDYSVSIASILIVEVCCFEVTSAVIAARKHRTPEFVENSGNSLPYRFVIRLLALRWMNTGAVGVKGPVAATEYEATTCAYGAGTGGSAWLALSVGPDPTAVDDAEGLLHGQKCIWV